MTDYSKKRFPPIEQVKRRVATAEGAVRKRRAAVANSEELKNVATSTSKVNYIDPRIVFTFISRVGAPSGLLEKIYTKALVQKFQWASAFVDKQSTPFIF